MKGVIIFCVVVMAMAGIIGITTLAAGYLPNTMFNARVQQKTCRVYCSMKSDWCRKQGNPFTEWCYWVFKNVKPNNTTTCWDSSVSAIFTNKQDAERYQRSCRAFDMDCLWDPENPCKYYTGYADTEGMLWTGLAFLAACFLFGFIGMIAALIARCSHHCSYEQV